MYRIILFLIILPHCVFGQLDSLLWIPTPPPHYSFVNYEKNSINIPSKMDTIFRKLTRIKAHHKGKLNIIHIGDSHIQCDMMTSKVRNGMQDFFGNSGRGLVFPYQLAKTNGPKDLRTASNTSWKSNKMGANKYVLPGISGYGIKTDKDNAVVKFQLKDLDDKKDFFNKISFFLCDDSACYVLTDSCLNKPYLLKTRPGIDTPSLIFESDTLMTSFGFEKVPSEENNPYNFYGVSLERRDTPGILYHSIGVNGARFDQFLGNDLFWKQLKALKGDLFILSMGTNEAQNPSINVERFTRVIDSIVKRIHKIAPRATIMFTTPAASYFKQKSQNLRVQIVANSITKYCEEKEIPFWDLFTIMGGNEKLPTVKKYHLLSKDLVHYSFAGYDLQGLLLVDALANEYNTYLKHHPPPPLPKKPKIEYQYFEKPARKR